MPSNPPVPVKVKTFSYGDFEGLLLGADDDGYLISEGNTQELEQIDYWPNDEIKSIQRRSNNTTTQQQQTNQPTTWPC